jgi:NADPH2:quinone reductase
MKAIYIQQHGPIESLKVTDVARPALRQGEILIAVEFAGVNPSDLISARGGFPGSLLPRILGRDFSGRVVEGPADLVGATVWGTGGELGITRDGTHAEYLAIPSSAATRLPNGLSAEAAAVAGLPFVTAYSALIKAGQLESGEWVIVSGAAGAVGQAAVQLAKAHGARVIALLRNASEEGMLRTDGVDAVALSDNEDLADVVMKVTSGKGASLALNGVGASIMDSLLASLAVNGRVVIYSSAGGNDFNLSFASLYRRQISLYGVETQLLDSSQCAEILKQLTPLFEGGFLKPAVIAERFPLDCGPDAYKRLASGIPGKAVLMM